MKVVVEKLAPKTLANDDYPPLGIIKAHIKSIFDQFGGIAQLIEGKREIYLKPNGIDFKPKVFTHPGVLEAMILLLQEAGAEKIYVMENATQSMITRVVFEITGYKQICKRTGAIPIYLDEERTVSYPFASSSQDLDYDLKEFQTSKTIAKILRHRDEVVYINLPKLKTHSMTAVTLGIKNQWGFPKQRDRGYDHNYNLHDKIVDVLELIQPDFTLIDGIEGTIYGHYHAEKLHSEVIKRFGVLIGGKNVLAVDIVGARVFGLETHEIPHLEIAIKRKLYPGLNRFEDIELIGDLSEFTTKYPWGLYPKFPDFVNIVRGTEMACQEGCVNNPLATLQVFWLDHHGHGKFDLVHGKGFDPDEIDALTGPVLIVGKCAISEVSDRLIRRLGKRNVYMSDSCNNLAQTSHALLKLLGLKPLDLIPLSLPKKLYVLFLAKLHGTKANLPPLF